MRKIYNVARGKLRMRSTLQLYFVIHSVIIFISQPTVEIQFHQLIMIPHKKSLPTVICRLLSTSVVLLIWSSEDLTQQHV